MHTLVHSDAEKDIYCVQVTVVRNEKVNSGSMQFTHPRYITFGQLVMFTDAPVECLDGMLVFKRGQDAELERIIDHLPYGKEHPEETILFEEPE